MIALGTVMCIKHLYQIDALLIYVPVAQYVDYFQDIFFAICELEICFHLLLSICELFCDVRKEIKYFSHLFIHLIQIA